MSSRSIPSFSGTTSIILEKLNGKNYLSWSASVELWFLGQGFHDHLEEDGSSVPQDQIQQWKKTDFQLCALLWQSVEPNILSTLRAFKTCHSFWKKAQNIFTNDIQRLYDSANRLSSLKQSDNDMVTFMAEAQSAVEELKVFLEVDSLEEIKGKLDKFYMVMILRAMNPEFNHIRDQILTSQEVPSIENLITHLLRVPSLKHRNVQENVESSTMISFRGKGNRGARGGRGARGRPQCTYCKRMGHTQENCYSLHGFPGKTANISKAESSETKFSEEEYQKYLKLKSSNLA